MPRYHGGIIWPGQSEGAERPLRRASRPAGSRKSLACKRESADRPLEQSPSGGAASPPTVIPPGPKGITNDTAVSPRYHPVTR